MTKWIFKNVPPKLDELSPQVQQKALEIARKLVDEKKIQEEKALKKGIKQAEEWFFNCHG